MKTYLLSFMFLVSGICSSSAQNSGANKQTVNPIIGNESFVDRFGEEPSENSGNELRIKTHLRYAEKILREKTASGYSEEQMVKRYCLLDLLHDYWKRGSFPKNYDFPEERKPCFIDRDGTICAVGYLVEQTAGRDAAEYINSQFQYEELMNMNDPLLDDWVKNSGFTKEEIATIQPTYQNDLWFAKRNAVGMRAGIGINSVSSKTLGIDPKMQAGFIGGLTMEHRFLKGKSIQLDILYEKRGFNYEGMFTNETGAVIDNFKVEYHYDYISFPVRFGFHEGAGIYLFANMGLAPSLLLKGYHSYPDLDSQGNVTGTVTDDYTDEISKFNMTGVVQAGGGFKMFHQKLWLFSQFELQRSIMPFGYDGYFTQNDMYSWGFNFNIGVKYGI